MAFKFDFLTKVSSSMNMDKSYNSTSGDVAARVPAMYMYNASANGANETAATVVAANYFQLAYAYLSVGDLIYINSNDPAHRLIAVATSSNAGVTLAALT